MKRKSILAISAIGVLVASMTGSALADTGLKPWQHVFSGGVLYSGERNTLVYVVAPDYIPKHTDLFTGYAWIYANGPNTVFVSVTHDGVRDSVQDPDGWHSHNVKLAFHTSNGSDACIVGLDHDTIVQTHIFANFLGVNVKNSELTGKLTGKVVAFEIVKDSGCAGTGLGVNLS